MNSLQDMAIQTYKNNLIYFEKKQPQLYSKLAAFDSAIEQKLYSNKYDLILKDGYFDVLELTTQNYLYSSDSYEYAKQASNSIDFERSTNAFATFKDVTIKEKELNIFEKFDITEDPLTGFAPILYYVDGHLPQNTSLQKIEKFIFFGVGLGTHIEAIDGKINASFYMIVEDDLELFKLSLFTMPYFELASHSELIFSVFDTELEFAQNSAKFLETAFYHNHYIKYFNMLSHSEDKLKEFHTKIASQSHNLFYYNSILEQFLRPLHYLKNNFNFTNIISLNTNPAFTDKPVLLLAAGPSLQKNINWLKKNHKKYLIIALSATLSLLERNKISPDIVTHIDGFKTASIHFNRLSSMEFLKDTIFLISARSSRDIVDRLNKEHVFFFENTTSYKKNFGNLAAPCVGSTTYLLAIIFGIKELYLLGLDLAIDEKSGSTHSSEHAYTKKLDLTALDLHDDKLSYKYSLTKVVGNFQKEVPTTTEYKVSIDSINTSSQTFKSNNQNVYNLSDGAFFTNTIPTKIASLNLDFLPDMDKSSTKQEVYNIFKINSSNKITPDELGSLKEKVNYALKTKNILLVQKNSSFNSYEDFLSSLITLFNKLSVSSSPIDYDLSLVYKEYFRFIYTFIFNFFNTQKLEDKSIHANHINQLLCKQLLRIEKTYTREL